MQKVAVPVLPRTKQFLLNYHAGKQPVAVDLDSFLGKLFESSMTKVPFEPPNKYVPHDCELITFLLPTELDTCTLTDRTRNLIGQALDYFFREMFGFGGACQARVTENEHLAAKDIIEAFGLESLYEANSGRHLIVRRAKRFAKRRTREAEKKFGQNFAATRTRNSATPTESRTDVHT